MLRRIKAYRNAPKEVERLAAELHETQKTLAATKERLVLWRERAEKAEAEPFEVSRILWIFGAGRTGSTWLSNMMEELPGYAIWREPLVGDLFGSFYEKVDERERRSPHFILGCHREAWLNSVRRFVCEGAATRFSHTEGWLVIKEPNGSLGADLLSKALPESLLVALVRDPRDVIASVVDAFSKEGFVYKRRERGGWDFDLPEEKQLDRFVEYRAGLLAQQMSTVVEAYHFHEGPKALIRYEDLLADTFGEMHRLYSELGTPVDEDDLAMAIEKHSWQNIPEAKRGEGKFYRKATPGGWREDLTSEQEAVVEEVCAPILEEFYP